MIKQEDNGKYYRKRDNQAVTAVQIKLVTDGLIFYKWGAKQLAQPNDWLVDNNGDCYTVAADTFASTYHKISEGRYVKHTLVRARQATEAGVINTLEGSTDYQPGDYIVSNSSDHTSDTYAIDRDTFEALYVLQEKDNTAG